MTQAECQSECKTLEEAGYLNAGPAALICTIHMFVSRAAEIHGHES